MIKEFTQKTLGKNKAGWRFDKKRELWVTYEVDTTLGGGKRVRKRGFQTESDAKNYLERIKLSEKLREYGVEPKKKFPTVKELLDRHHATITHPKQIVSNRRVFDNFVKLLPAGLRLDALAKAHYKKHADWRLSEQRKDRHPTLTGVKINTVKKELGFIYAAINKADEYFEEVEKWNPPKTYKFDESDEARGVPVPDQDWRKFVDYLLREREEGEIQRDWRARRRAGLTFYFALLTGLRHGEVSGVLKENYDPVKRSLKAERFKTSKKGIRWTTFEPLTDIHVWVLNEARDLYPESPFFFSTRGKIHNKNYEIMTSAAKHPGLKYGRYTGFVVHSARHSFASALEDEGVSRTTARGLSAHTKDKMFDRYAHETLRAKGAALSAIESRFSLFQNSDNELNLKEIFELVAGGEMDFEEFEAQIGKYFATIY